MPQEHEEPCKALVEQIAVTNGHFEITALRLKQMNKDMEGHKDSFNELKLSIAECLKGMSRGLEMLNDGRHRFDFIENSVKLKFDTIETNISEHLLKTNESRDGCIKKNKKMFLMLIGGIVSAHVGVAITYIVLVKTGHGESLADILVKFLT